MTRRSRGSGSNEGIQANSVTADVVAVGRGARAEKVVLGREDQRQLVEAIADLKRGIEGLQLSAANRKSVEADVAAIEQMSRAAQDPEQARSRILDLISTFKTIGVAVSDIVTLVEPIRKIVGLLHLGITV